MTKVVQLRPRASAAPPPPDPNDPAAQAATAQSIAAATATPAPSPPDHGGGGGSGSGGQENTVSRPLRFLLAVLATVSVSSLMAYLTARTLATPEGSRAAVAEANARIAWAQVRLEEEKNKSLPASTGAGTPRMEPTRSTRLVSVDGVGQVRVLPTSEVTQEPSCTTSGDSVTPVAGCYISLGEGGDMAFAVEVTSHQGGPRWEAKSHFMISSCQGGAAKWVQPPDSQNRELLPTGCLLAISKGKEGKVGTAQLLATAPR